MHIFFPPRVRRWSESGFPSSVLVRTDKLLSASIDILFCHEWKTPLWRKMNLYLCFSARKDCWQRQEAVNRAPRARFLLWRAGKVGELWERLHREEEEKRRREEIQRVAPVVCQGLPLRAASNWALAASPLAQRRPTLHSTNYSHQSTCRSEMATQPPHPPTYSPAVQEGHSAHT